MVRAHPFFSGTRKAFREQSPGEVVVSKKRRVFRLFFGNVNRFSKQGGEKDGARRDDWDFGKIWKKS